MLKRSLKRYLIVRTKICLKKMGVFQKIHTIHVLLNDSIWLNILMNKLSMIVNGGLMIKCYEFTRDTSNETNAK